MKKDSAFISKRRDLIKAVGGTAVLLPVIGLGACSGGDDSAAPAASKKPESAAAPTEAMEPKEAMPEPAAAGPATPATDSSGASAARLSEDDPQAKSLAYVHDAADIDASAQPRYKAGQVCSNCALYTGKDGDEWGGCSIFPGRQVKATGWCSVYAPKA